MSMLADHRRKTKWVINPTKKPLWSTDSSGIKFGKQLMEKMGWSAGKGLGLNEQGIQEPLKVSFKNDTKGMGFKGNDDDWIEHQDEFNTLLNQLSSSNDLSVMKSSDVERNEIKSLEEKSKKSKARVHYQKFTRGKDLSKYSENDLACILGTGKTKKKDVPKIEEVVECETKTNGNFETSFGVTTINSGSIQDYFKKKWTIDKVKPTGAASTVEEEIFRPSFSNNESYFSVNDEFCVKSEVEEQAFSKMKHWSSSEKESSIKEESRMTKLSETEKIIQVEEKKRKKEAVQMNTEEEPEIKRRKNSDDNSGPTNESLRTQTENLLIPDDELESKEEKKARKKAKRNREKCTVNNNLLSEEINDANNEVEIIEVESVKRKKIKKSKKEKTKENLVDIEYNSSNQAEASNGDLNESGLEVEPSKSKKKRGKLERAEKINNSTQDVHSSGQKDSSLEVVNTERSSDTYHNESNVEIVKVKKKKKKNEKKEKVFEFDNINEEVPDSIEIENSTGEINSDTGEINNSSGRENTLEFESGKRKKKKKAKKLEENKEIQNELCHSNKTEEFCVQETKSEKIDGICEIELEVESAKKKRKKKKDVKHNLVDNEYKAEEDCLEGENTFDVELVLKKQKKKHKKEKMEDSEGIKNKEEPVNQNDKDCGGKETEIINNEVSSGLKVNTEGEDRLQKLRTTLFPDQAAEKYFPEQNTNERVLKLIRWANITEFKGSNLNDVEGYGRRKMCQKQSR